MAHAKSATSAKGSGKRPRTEERRHGEKVKRSNDMVSRGSGKVEMGGAISCRAWMESETQEHPKGFKPRSGEKNTDGGKAERNPRNRKKVLQARNGWQNGRRCSADFEIP